MPAMTMVFTVTDPRVLDSLKEGDKARFTADKLNGAYVGLPVSFTSTTPGVCTVAGNSVTAVLIGTCTIAANRAGDANYNAALQVTQDIAVKAGQTITLGPQAAKTFGDPPFPLNPLATASSGLPVSYSSLTPGVCTIAGSSVTLVAAGSCTLAADQAGDATYAPAAQVTQNIAIAGPASGVDPVPTLSEWALMVLASLMLAIGIPFARRRA
jgi:hypothetical protein